MSGVGYPKFKNDRGVPEICIGAKEFMCIGELKWTRISGPPAKLENGRSVC
jgi:hypothetical protein